MAVSAALPSLGRPESFAPWPARVEAVREEVRATPATRRVVTLSLQRGDLDWRPGQFLQVTVFGAGEIPIGIASPPNLAGTVRITVRDAGLISGLLTRLTPGAVVGLRGPFGNGFDLDAHRGRDLLFVAGGMGFPPLRGVLWQALLERESFGRLVVLHGARTPRELLYGWQYANWKARGVEVYLSVDHGDGCWERQEDPPRCEGIITALFDRARVVPERTAAFLCGPAIMIKVGAQQLVERLGLAPQRCFATLERHMKCGVGKCGHCVLVDRYVCVDGPVFRYDELLALARIEAPW